MDVSITITSGVPAGTSLSYRGGVVPHGYLLEDGSTLSKALYPRLFEAIGYTYGGSDDSFNLPDSRGRTDIGSGQGASLTDRELADTGGAETHTLTIAQMPSHTHIQNAHDHGFPAQTGSIAVDAGTTPINILWPTSPGNQLTHSKVATNQNEGGGQAHNNMQPFLVATKMIKY